MSLINFKSVLSYSSEDQIHCAKNLLYSEQYKKWLSSNGSDERIVCILEFEKSSVITSLDIGNDGSAFVELLVSKSSSESDDWTVLLPQTILMTPNESRANKNRNQVKTFKTPDLNKTCLNETWDRLKIVCEQKFNISDQFGLTFIKLYSIIDDNQKTNIVSKSLSNIVGDEDEHEPMGSFFIEKKFKSISNDSDNEKSVSKSVIQDLPSKNSINDNDDEILKTNNIQNGKSQIMKNVVFVLSGFQNPFRSQLRNKAVSMGASYSDDWNGKCTHLISAFSNTPKYNEVLQSGRGFIVNKQWIVDSHRQNQLLPETRYEFKEKNENETSKRKLESNIGKNDDEDEINDIIDTKQKNIKEKSSKTTNKSAKKKSKLGELPDFFNGKHFYVSYGDYDDNTLLSITRIILAYDGILERQITNNVKYVITNRLWNQDFAQIAKSNPDVNFITIGWLQECHDTDEFVPIQPYLVVP